MATLSHLQISAAHIGTFCELAPSHDVRSVTIHHFELPFESDVCFCGTEHFQIRIKKDRLVEKEKNNLRLVKLGGRREHYPSHLRSQPYIKLRPC